MLTTKIMNKCEYQKKIVRGSVLYSILFTGLYSMEPISRGRKYKACVAASTSAEVALFAWHRCARVVMDRNIFFSLELQHPARPYTFYARFLP